MTSPNRIDVAELRQNLPDCLGRVKQGETLEVTEQGEPIARLSPPPTGNALDRWIAEGKVIAPKRDLRDLPPPAEPVPGAISISEALEEQRRERL
jgi:antitoxin (DNA-binding transcriptional repressor) of toxin-antitoxin stability system